MRAVFFTGWGMYFGKRSFFNIPEYEVFQVLGISSKRIIRVLE